MFFSLLIILFSKAFAREFDPNTPGPRLPPCQRDLYEACVTSHQAEIQSVEEILNVLSQRKDKTLTRIVGFQEESKERKILHELTKQNLLLLGKEEELYLSEKNLFQSSTNWIFKIGHSEEFFSWALEQEQLSVQMLFFLSLTLTKQNFMQAFWFSNWQEDIHAEVIQSRNSLQEMQKNLELIISRNSLEIKDLESSLRAIESEISDWNTRKMLHVRECESGCKIRYCPHD